MKIGYDNMIKDEVTFCDIETLDETKVVLKLRPELAVPEKIVITRMEIVMKKTHTKILWDRKTYHYKRL